MAWVRIDIDLPMDGRLTGSGHAWAWPAVVCRAKIGDGRIHARELSPRIMAHLWGPSVEEWAEALAHFREEGLLVDDGEHVVVANWSAYQRDNNGAERVRKHRESKRATVTVETLHPVTPPDVTQCNDMKRDVTAYSTVQYETVQDTAAVAAVTRAATTLPAGLPHVLERWRLALRGRSGAAPLVVGALDVDALTSAVADKGADHVNRCIDRAAEVAGGGGPSLSLLRMILRDGVHEPGKGAQQARGRANGAKVSSVYAAGVEASKNRQGARMVRVPGEGYVAEADLTDAQRARIEGDGGMVF
jgi:hypothetical protein